MTWPTYRCVVKICTRRSCFSWHDDVHCTSTGLEWQVILVSSTYLKKKSKHWTALLIFNFSSHDTPHELLLHTVSPTWKVTILNLYCGHVFRVRDFSSLDFYYKFMSILFSGKMFRQLQFLNFASFLRIFIEGGMVKWNIDDKIFLFSFHISKWTRISI